jgi:hypothetical protein
LALCNTAAGRDKLATKPSEGIDTIHAWGVHHVRLKDVRTIESFDSPALILNWFSGNYATHISMFLNEAHLYPTDNF